MGSRKWSDDVEKQMFCDISSVLVGISFELSHSYNGNLGKDEIFYVIYVISWNQKIPAEFVWKCVCVLN